MDALIHTGSFRTHSVWSCGTVVTAGPGHRAHEDRIDRLFALSNRRFANTVVYFPYAAFDSRLRHKL